MTLLAILFVLGVAFLATMNYEAERLAAEARHRKTELGAEVLIDDAGAFLRSGLMSDASSPFAGGDAAASASGFTQLPGWHNMSSPIEPYEKTPLNVNDPRVVVWPWFADPGSSRDVQKICIDGNDGAPCTSSVECAGGSCKDLHTCFSGPRSGERCHPDGACPDGFCEVQQPPNRSLCNGGPRNGAVCDPLLTCPTSVCRRAGFGGPRWPGAEIDVTWEPGVAYTLATCVGGPRDGASCYSPIDCGPAPAQCLPIRSVCLGGSRDGQGCLNNPDCPGGECVADSVTVVDADGDGVVDAVQADAARFGFSGEQIEQISSVVNAEANATGKTFVGIRVVPHGGMVNLNDAHPTLIERTLGINSVFDQPNPSLGIPNVRSAREQVFYAPQQEEPALRRRGIFPARQLPPTRLQGDPLVAEALRSNNPFGGADMPLQLFPPTARDGGSFETVFAGQHRYWPTRPFEPLYATQSDSPPYWLARMEPFISFNYDNQGFEYDLRHLVTTISHDALLSRGGQALIRRQPRDVRDLMMQVNGDFGGDCSVLPFEYADYPHDIENNTKPNAEEAICQCPDLKNCLFDPRKGRLQLSLPWLDDRIDRWITFVRSGASDGINIALQNKRLIYDVFYLLVRNAAGPEWDDVVCTLDAECNPNAANNEVLEFCSGDPNKPGLCMDRVLNLPRHEAKATRTAASLTANLLDYVDDRTCVGGELDGAPCFDDGDCSGGASFCGPADAPTRVAVRNFDFGGGVCVGAPGATYLGQYCRSRRDCEDLNNPTLSSFCTVDDPNLQLKTCSGGGPGIEGRYCDDTNPCPSSPSYGPGICVAQMGREINIALSPFLESRFEYVYGLERQPFFTEAVTVSAGMIPHALKGWAVELFNPNDVVINQNKEFEIVTVGSDGMIKSRLSVDESLDPRRFLAFLSNSADFIPVPTSGANGVVVDLGPTTTRNLQFQQGDTLYLVRRTAYADPPGSNNFGVVPVDVVVDAFLIQGNNFGAPDNPQDFNDPGMTDFVATAQRAVTTSTAWLAPVPFVEEDFGHPNHSVLADARDPQTLGTWNVHSQTDKIFPVEMHFPNTGSFSRPVPGLLLSDPEVNAVAVPTTGSLLMLMRYANHSLNDLTMPNHAPQATAPVQLGPRLAFTGWLNDSVTIYDPVTNNPLATINAFEQIDNGRMPVFDVGKMKDEDGDGVPETQYAANHRPARTGAIGRPGGVEHLPWGQLVFDYFTALPLSNRGPYRPDPTNLDAPYGLPGSQPRVDQRGLRVHGRIDLNAAPWTVLTGLPFVPMEEIPGAYRDRFREQIPIARSGGPAFDGMAAYLDDNLAQSIVAYRESREIIGFTGDTTGDYSAPGFGRSFTDPSPAYRRGRGFLTVGELANVRHDVLVNGFANGPFRIDMGEVERDPMGASGSGATGRNFIQAISLLASLGDWVTVRSDVFTVYGVVRGEADPSVAEDPTINPNDVFQLQIDDVDTRALRFQETIDRLPSFLGASSPARVGNRTLAKYRDTQSD